MRKLIKLFTEPEAGWLVLSMISAVLLIIQLVKIFTH